MAQAPDGPDRLDHHADCLPRRSGTQVRADHQAVSTRRIRVMYVVPDLNIGGAERHVTTLMPKLDPDRFSTSVICLGEKGTLFTDLEGTTTPATALNHRKRQAIRAILDLVQHMRDFRPDVVITRGYNAETLGRIAAALTRVPHNVVWVHNYGDITRRSTIRRLSDRLLDHVTSAYFGVAQAQTSYIVEELGYPADKVRIIYNGVDLDNFETDRSAGATAAAEFGIAPTDKVVAIVAALRPEKDHEMLLRAARMVVDAVPTTKLLIVGDGEMRSRIEQLTAELNLGDKVVMAGARSDIPAILQTVDVFALSSYSVECFPMALLEAMAAGRPAVCTAVGGVPEMVDAGTTGFLVPPHDPRAMADGLLRILTDDSLATAMGRAARVRVEREFSLSASVSATERELESLAKIEYYCE